MTIASFVSAMLLVWLLIEITSIIFTDFRAEQLLHDRVREAYENKGLSEFKILHKNHIPTGKFNLYLRAFKKEKLLEIWGKKVDDDLFVLLNTIPICQLSGDLGPKRREGDLQIP